MSRTILRTGLVMLAVMRYVKDHPGCSAGEAAREAAATASFGDPARYKANGSRAIRACLDRRFLASEPAQDRPGYALTLTALGAEQIDQALPVAS